MPEYPVRVMVELEGGGAGEHDFTLDSSCSVAGRVVLAAGDKGVAVQYRLGDQVKGARVTGNVGEDVPSFRNFQVIYPDIL